MLDQGTRAAILRLHQQSYSLRAIAKALQVSRGAVRQVIRAGAAEVPRLERAEKALPYRDQILELYQRCKGNLVRVHEELLGSGAQLSYQALTAFCRRQGIGQRPKQAVGEYHFQPAQEMQHDTSPHKVELGGTLRLVQTASLVLCYSRMLFFQFYPRFTRFECKVFLTDALQYCRGSCQVCMIDNTHVVVLQGTGRQMVPVPEMTAFADRYGFHFAAHEKGDANRSAHVERRFSYIEHNFLAGRSFRDFPDANQQAHQWCDKVNARVRRELKAAPRELFALEQPQLRPLPLWAPPVYRLHQRLVDLEGYVSVDTNRYAVPDEFIGLQVEVRQTKDQIEIYRGPRLVATHQRVLLPTGCKYRLPEQRRQRRPGVKRPETPREEQLLRQRAPELSAYIEALKQHYAGRATLPLRRLLGLVNDYPRPPLLAAIQTATQYGLYDLERVETIILRQTTRDYFQLSLPIAAGDDTDE